VTLLLINRYFALDTDLAKRKGKLVTLDADQTVRNAIEHVKSQQRLVLQALEHLPKDTI